MNLAGNAQCSTRLDHLHLNTDYSVNISMVSLDGQYEWADAVMSRPVRTEFSLPADFERIQVKSDTQLQTSLTSDSMINVVPPAVDATNGQIVESWLFLVNIGSLGTERSNASLNQTFRHDLVDQAYLTSLIEDTNRSCHLNETLLYRPCMLKRYQDSGFAANDLVLIGELNTSLKGLLNITNYENISGGFIVPHNVYQLFYVFKVGTNKSFLLFATQPSEPIKTAGVSQFDLTIGIQDGLALWIVILVSIVSILLLVVVTICLVIMLIIRYKPSKFHKAAQMVSQPRLNSSSIYKIKSQLNEKLGAEFGLQHGGMGGGGGVFYDFVEPGEFSSYDMTNIWLVKHANGDLILDEEYRNLPDYRNLKSSYASQAAKNEIKNRFLDIKAYDESRVILSSNGSNVSGMPNKAKLECNSQSQFSVDKSIISSMSTSTSSNNSCDLVGLPPINDNCGDYINANFVQGKIIPIHFS